MEFDQLKGFFHVAKLGSFTEAAKQLYLTQPAISLQVKALEKTIGERLLDRVGRSVRLTHAGLIVFKLTEELMHKFDELQHTVIELKKLEKGRLSLGASDTTSIHFLPGLLKAFLAKHPKVELKITSLISPQVVTKVLNRDLDLGIITLPCLDTRLDVVPLFEERLICILSREHPLAARKMLDLREIAAEPLILLEKGSMTRRRVDEYLAGSKSPCKPVLELSNFEIIKRYVASGFGISVVPEAAISGDRDGVRGVPLRQGLVLEVGAVFLRDRKLSQVARAFLAMAQEFFRETPFRADAAR